MLTISFQSTRPVRGATNKLKVVEEGALFQSTRPVRGATGTEVLLDQQQAFQSTRPVRGATSIHELLRIFDNISIHAPRAGRDSSCIKPCISTMAFQSTRPVRGATDAWSHNTQKTT